VRSPAIRGVLVGLALLAIGAAILHRAGAAADPLPRLGGTGPWLLSRVTGITAFVALSLDVALGLAISTGAVGAWLTRGHAVDLHRWLSPVSLALIAGHAGVLLLDRFVAFDVVDLLVPFASRHQPLAVGLGVLAGYLVLVVHASFALRRRLGTVTWRRLHALSFVGYAAAAGHAILAGTDAFRPWAIALTAPAALLVAVLGARRVTARARRPGSRRIG
jgi:sulfoxide reductase heme-binding subunit YedZ